MSSDTEESYGQEQYIKQMSSVEHEINNRSKQRAREFLSSNPGSPCSFEQVFLVYKFLESPESHIEEGI